jgi:shikimate 5-dehydrogenase
VERVVILNRRRHRAGELAARFAAPGFRVDVAAPEDDLATERFDLAVNATPLGLRPDDPLPPTGGARFAAALDLVYAPAETAWVRAMRERGVPAADGKEMLLHQGAAAFRRWWGAEPPVDVMRAALAGGEG